MPSRSSIRARPPRKFDPRHSAEVRAGYWWSAAQASGLGTAAFKIPEGNGNTSFDLIQATVASQPTVLAEMSGAQFRMRKAADANPSKVAPSGNLAAGWTGATYVAGWWRLPDASGDITGTGNLLVHGGAPTPRRLSLALSSTNDRIVLTTSVDGTATTLNSWASTFVGGSWTWIEGIFDPALVLGGSTDADRAKLFSNFVLQTPATTASHPSTIADSNTVIGVSCRAAAALANVDTTDIGGAVYYIPGIPNLLTRIRLANLSNPSGIKLAA